MALSDYLTLSVAGDVASLASLALLCTLFAASGGDDGGDDGGAPGDRPVPPSVVDKYKDL